VPSHSRPTGRTTVILRVLRAAGAAAAAAALVAWLLPRVSGAPWHYVGAVLGTASVLQVLLLALIWAAGLVVHSTAQTAAMPGLTVRRALTLNLTGSAVSNVLPLGGGIGIGMNYLMVKRWGFSARQFSQYAGLLNAWHVGAKAVLPATAVGLLVADDVLIRRGLLIGAFVSSALLLLGVLLAAAALLTARGARVIGRSIDAVRWWVLHRPSPTPTAQRLETVRASSRELLRAAWRPMTLGVTGYVALQVLLLWTCLGVVGAGLPLVAVIAVYAVERAATVLPFTPGGSGVVEVAATAAVVGLGGAPAVAAAGVLLYRAFVFGAEIPVGATWLAGWWYTQRGARRLAVA
jgi:putative heme transporter